MFFLVGVLLMLDLGDFGWWFLFVLPFKKDFLVVFCFFLLYLHDFRGGGFFSMPLSEQISSNQISDKPDPIKTSAMDIFS